MTHFPKSQGLKIDESHGGPYDLSESTFIQYWFSCLVLSNSCKYFIDFLLTRLQPIIQSWGGGRERKKNASVIEYQDNQ